MFQRENNTRIYQRDRWGCVMGGPGGLAPLEKEGFTNFIFGPTIEQNHCSYHGRAHVGTPFI